MGLARPLGTHDARFWRCLRHNIDLPDRSSVNAAGSSNRADDGSPRCSVKIRRRYLRIGTSGRFHGIRTALLLKLRALWSDGSADTIARIMVTERLCTLQHPLREIQRALDRRSAPRRQMVGGVGDPLRRPSSSTNSLSFIILCLWNYSSRKLS